MDQRLNKRLIEVISKNNCLYDGASPDYRNRHVKAKIWRKIAHELNEKDSHCKNRWVSLRDSYKRWKRKEKRSSGKNKTHKFKYADDMAFLENVQSYYIPKDNDNSTYFSGDDYTDDDDDDDEPVNDSDKAIPSLEYTEMEDKQEANEACKSSDAVTSRSANPVTSITENDQIMQPDFMEVKTAGSSDNEVSIKDPLTPRSSTSLLFESLARKIVASGMPQAMVDAIELKAVKIVYDEIAKARPKQGKP